jgi:serine/threonine-protein kinase
MSGTIPGPQSGPSGSSAEPKVGNKIGPYRLVRLLGQGTSGRVFEVEHVKIGRRAAMKTLSSEHATRPGSVKRLFTEALAVNRINNPHIVEVTDLVESGEHHLVENGRESVSSLKVNALVMELLEGQSLAQAMVGEGPMPPERFLPILAQVAEALAAAHAAGFIHRDLKPENIFLTERSGQPDFVKLLDFGLTKIVNLDEESLGNPALATLDGTFVGTPAYVSPEQISSKAVDHRTDIYALGVILYELVCGRLPFEGESVGDFLIKHLTVPAPSLPDEIRATKLGRTLDAIVQRCMDKNPAARFPSAAQLVEIFHALARGEPVQFTAMESYLASWPPRRHRVSRVALRVALGAAVGLALSGILWFLTSESRREHAAAHAAVERTAGAPTAAAPEHRSEADAVTVRFESDPPGAEARVIGQHESLGRTPFERVFPRRDASLALELTLPGYEPVRVATSTATSRMVSVTLTRSARRPRPASRSASVETTINPFR